MRFSPLTRLLAALGIGLATQATAHAYSPEAIDTLRFMIEEEKLAGAVYRAFADLYPEIRPFQNIPRSEDMHFATLVAQADLAGVDVSDLTGLGATTFQDASLGQLYLDLVAEGSTSAYAALGVGRNVELLDIADLTAARTQVAPGSTLDNAYVNLMRASQNHLNAFTRWQSMTPMPVSAVPEPHSYGLFLAGLGVLGAVARRRGHAAKATALA